ncbi:MAG: ice-binding family protein [Dehalococcoidia bacterium]|nr:ice-binding family protein [Dehalococcoidia bacterium]
MTNTNTTNVYGNLGVNPGTAVTGFESVDSGPGTVHGSIYTGTDAEAVSARSGVTAAYSSLAGQACLGHLTGQDLGGQTLTAGVYCFDTSAGMTGTLTLDGQGSSDATFIIRTGSTLTTASGSSVNLVNGANACNVFWQVGSSATLGTTTSFVGNLLATESITLDSGAMIIGRALAGSGAVTMDNNTVDARQCTAPATSETQHCDGDPDRHC